MDQHPATDRNGFSRPLLQPVVLTPAEVKQVAGGDAGPADYNKYAGSGLGGGGSSSGDDAKGCPRDD